MFRVNLTLYPPFLLTDDQILFSQDIHANEIHARHTFQKLLSRQKFSLVAGEVRSTSI
jgi:hypothetical protein